MSGKKDEKKMELLHHSNNSIFFSIYRGIRAKKDQMERAEEKKPSIYAHKVEKRWNSHTGSRWLAHGGAEAYSGSLSLRESLVECSPHGGRETGSESILDGLSAFCGGRRYP